MVGCLDFYNNICYSNFWNNMNGYIFFFCMLINEKFVKIIVSCYNELLKYFFSNDIDIIDFKWGM